MSAREEVPVELERVDWFRLINAAHHGLEEIPDAEERGRAEGLIDEVIDQATITVVETIELEHELRQRLD